MKKMLALVLFGGAVLFAPSIDAKTKKVTKAVKKTRTCKTKKCKKRTASKTTHRSNRQLRSIKK